jgi:hypothetical protein
MAKQLRVANPGGYSKNPNQKIIQVTTDQGFKGIDKMQGTTRIIYDAVQLSTNAENQTLTLFDACNKRQFPLTNLTENKLQVGEAMTLERFSCYIIECTTGTTKAVGVLPLNYFAQFNCLYASTMNFQIAQDTVIKKMPLASLFAPFNPHSKFMGYYNNQPAGGALTSWTYPQDIYHFETSIVLPPQIEFLANFQIPPITLPAGYDFYFAMKIEGIGSLYAPKANY